MTTDNLYCLSDLKNYKLHEDDPDIIRWEVDGANMRIGKVTDFIVDTQLKEAVYLEVEWESRMDAEQQVFMLIPMEYVRVNKEERRVKAPFLDTWNVGYYPTYHQKITSGDIENRLRNFAKYIPDRQSIGKEENMLDPASSGYYASTLRLKYLEMKKEEALKELVALNKEIAKTRLNMDRNYNSDNAR